MKLSPALGRSFKALIKLRCEIPKGIEMESMELSSLAEDINVKTREASQNTNLDMQKYLGIDKTL